MFKFRKGSRRALARTEELIISPPLVGAVCPSRVLVQHKLSFDQPIRFDVHASHIASDKHRYTRKNRLGRRLDATSIVHASDQIDSTVFDLSNVLHSIRSIPDDVLCEIFKECMPLPFYTDVIPTRGVDSLNPSEPPWTLSQVCRRWRSISISYPRLWSVVVPPVSPSQNNYLSINRRLALQLERSFPCDLSIGLPDGLTWMYLNDLLCLLRPHTNRWRILNAYLSPTRLKNLAGCPFNNLTSLHLATLSSDNVDTIETFQNAIKLSSFQQVDGRYLYFVVPVGRLKFCSLAFANLELLRHRPFKALEELKIEDDNLDSTETLDSPLPLDPPLVLSSLRSLTIKDREYSGLTLYVTRGIIAPVLSSLDVIYTETHLFTLPILIYPEMLTRLSISISLLTNDVLAKFCEIEAFLRQTMNLESFTFLGEGLLGTEMVQVLGAGKSTLLPRLTSLRLDDKTLEDSCSKVVSMVGSRSLNDNAPWCTVSIPSDLEWMYEDESVAFKLGLEGTPQSEAFETRPLYAVL